MQDVIIVGGGAAGLSAALLLGRSRRSVTIIDDGRPRNAPADGVHGFLTRDGVAPLELTRLGRADLAPYDVRIEDGIVAGAERTDNGFRVVLEDGTAFKARRVLVTTGLTDVLPDIPGLAERWGKDLAHCPYCHGWEIRDRAIGVIGNGSFAAHQALLFRQWSDNITLFLNDAPQTADVELVQLAARGIRVVPGTVRRVVSTDEAVSGVELDDGTTHAIQALTTQPRAVARAAFLTGLGLVPTTTPFGETIESDDVGLTAVPGVWAAGNVKDMKATVLAAAQGGAAAAVAINMDLMVEEVAEAVAAHSA
ncbi:thioredoxin reductase [Arthrobacter sp. ERGS1:01]|uniref:NAD(P)/FAD-dependent oxidoreductase n=1 Tax=Arthrobacter sp. ERGS1:01 TaxID=1704044 RepID=UPI0006B5F954|nr:NAD(P)/FAD-dependent oxidoreductase [Arthrobacter sp. ERGS1:01]ALE05034.1 thioredoxin reductase [Arthrobacter sp. ERGS1:01]